MSLLEKRLLGGDRTTSPATIKKIEETDTGSPNQQNTSKRTVYVNSNDPSLCEICHKTWPAKKHLWQHYIRCHKSVAATVCGICLKTNDSYAILQQHLARTHPTLLHGQGFGSNFICRICGRYHNASSKLKLHMAIHEQFDWSLLDEPQKKSDSDDDDDDVEIKEENGYEHAGINYDSLIEQVECTSASDTDKEEKNNTTSDEEEEEEEVEESEEESDGSLQNRMIQRIKEEDEDEEFVSSSEEVTADEDTVDSVREDTIEEEGGEDEDTADEVRDNEESSASSYKTDVFVQEESSDSNSKSAELVSAVQSIKYECVDDVDNEIEIEYVDLQAQTLNENEIESAVGSIL